MVGGSSPGSGSGNTKGHAPPLGLTGLRSLVSSSNLLAVEIIENLSSETREGGGGHAMKIMMRVIHFDLE